jgi:hypothetical protein
VKRSMLANSILGLWASGAAWPTRSRPAQS